jgi:hypothetical protein
VVLINDIYSIKLMIIFYVNVMKWSSIFLGMNNYELSRIICCFLSVLNGDCSKISTFCLYFVDIVIKFMMMIFVSYCCFYESNMIKNKVIII